MEPVQTPESNAVFVLEGCGDLPAIKCHDQSGMPYVESCWTLTPEERQRVFETGKIYLLTMGEYVPPVLLTVESSVLKEGEEP